jgi:hypothetical protein
MSVPPTAIAYNVGSARTTAPTSMDEFSAGANMRNTQLRHEHAVEKRAIAANISENISIFNSERYFLER